GAAQEVVPEVDQADVDRGGGNIQRPLLSVARCDLHDPPGTETIPADLDRRQCRSGGCAHRAARAAVVYQPACRVADDRAAMATLQAGARRSEPADARYAADRPRTARRTDP